MEIETTTATRYGKKGESGAVVMTASTTQTLIGNDGKNFSKTVSFSMVLLPSGSFLPEIFLNEPKAEAALDEHEAQLKRKRHPRP